MTITPGDTAVSLPPRLADATVATAQLADVDPPAAVTAWLRAAAVPISTDPTAALDDFAPLRAALASARVVGLGEATHGSAEFFRLKHRFVRFLVTELGHTAFTIEGFPAECMVLDEYVRTGVGDPSAAVRMLYAGGFPWDTEEVLAFVVWLRAHNAGLAADAQVGFYGFDVHGSASAVLVARYLDRLGELDAFGEALAELSTGVRMARFHARPAPAQQDTLFSLNRLVAWLDTDRARLVERGGADAWRNARLGAEAIRQVATVPLPTQPAARLRGRERGQATLIRTLLDLQGEGGKITCWAHNGHLMRGDFYDDVPACGDYLARELGRDYLPIGQAFNGGTFRAGDLDDPTYGRRDFTVEPAPRGTFDGALAGVDADCFVVDLRSAPAAVAEWLAGSLATRSVGGGFSTRTDVAQWFVGSPSATFDLIAFVQNTTAALALTPSSVPITEQVDEWEAELGPGPLRYGCTRPSSERVRLERADAPWLGGQATLRQTVDADAYRGRSVTFTVPAAAAVDHLAGDAELFVAVRRAGVPAGPDSTGSGETFVDVARSEREHAIGIDVPPDAEVITFGVRLVGAGWVEAGPFRINSS